jgi:hypothetical protein
VIALRVIVAGAPLLSAVSPARPEDRTAIAAQSVSQLAEQIPDGAGLIDLYKAARTVTDVEAANGEVKDQVVRAESLAADLARLHAAKMNVCEDVEQSHLEATATKARALSATLARIDGELTRSLATMRQKLVTERTVSTRAKDDVNRLTIAAHQLGRLNLQTQELAKAIQAVARNIRSAAASCLPTPIPPLFAEGNTPSSRVVSISRSPPARRRPTNAPARPAPFFPRF